MDSDGTYRKKSQEGAPVNAQETFMREALSANRASAAAEKKEKRSSWQECSAHSGRRKNREKQSGKITCRRVMALWTDGQIKGIIDTDVL